MAEKTYRFNLIAVAALVIALFLAGYFARKAYVKNKELRAIELIADQSANNIKALVKLNLQKDDTIADLKKLIEKSDQVLVDKNKKIRILEARLIAIQQEELPVSVKYDKLIELAGPDSLPKDYGFSELQIGYLYGQVIIVPILKEQVEMYKSTMDAFAYSLELAGEKDRLLNDKISIYEVQELEYAKLIDNKDLEIRTLKKSRRGRSWYAVGVTAVAILTSAIAISK